MPPSRPHPWVTHPAARIGFVLTDIHTHAHRHTLTHSLTHSPSRPSPYLNSHPCLGIPTKVFPFAFSQVTPLILFFPHYLHSPKLHPQWQSTETFPSTIFLPASRARAKAATRGPCPTSTPPRTRPTTKLPSQRRMVSVRFARVQALDERSSPLITALVPASTPLRQSSGAR